MSACASAGLWVCLAGWAGMLLKIPPWYGVARVAFRALGEESGKEPGALCSLSGTASSLRRPGLYTELRSQLLNTPLTSL